MIKEPLSLEERGRLPHADWAHLVYAGTESDPEWIEMDFLFLVRPGGFEPVDRDESEAVVDVVVCDGARRLAFVVARRKRVRCVVEAVVGWDRRSVGRPVDELVELLEHSCPDVP